MTVIWKPALFQGRNKKKNYFEGWYFKSVSADEESAYAIIAGLSITSDITSHAFVMIMDSRKQKLYYAEYPLNEFWANDEKFEIKIGKNIFSLDTIHLDTHTDNQDITADLTFKNIIQWPVTRSSPGAMGWYRFIPFMECYHGVLSFDHSIHGYIEINGKKIDLTNGKGYIEKDWGSSMPSSWIWMQTNHFDEEGISLFGSIAKIPWLHNYFTGYIFGLLYKGHLYKFTTYTGAKVVDLTVSKEKIEIKLEDKSYQLEIQARRTEGVDLPAPKLGEMTAKVNESLKSDINIILSNKDTGQVIFSGNGRNSGLEFVGDIEELVKGLKK